MRARKQILHSYLHFLAAALAAVLFSAHCSGKYNVVRLQRDKTRTQSQLSLSTEHYLRSDDNYVAELDRGERRIHVRFSRKSLATKIISDELEFFARLYDDDPALTGKIQIIVDSVPFDFPITGLTATRNSEDVTVLDTGQRQVQNPALSNDVQAQVGYTTFGKPAAAGSVKRHWMVYRFKTAATEAFGAAARKAARAGITLTFGTRRAEAQLTPKEIRAWQKYFTNEPDEEIEAGENGK